MGRGTVREERGKPVTEVTFKPQGRSPGLNSLTPSTCPHVHTMNTLTHKKAIKNETIGMLKRKITGDKQMLLILKSSNYSTRFRISFKSV